MTSTNEQVAIPTPLPWAARRFTLEPYAISLSLLLVTIAGCQSPPPAGERSVLPPTLDRLVNAYADLANRKFEVLADFEDPIQGELFRREPDGRARAVTLSTEQAQRDTGVGSLKMSLMDSSQSVSAQDSPDSRWALHRDWSRHPLLLFSVFSPRPLGGFRFSVRSGTDVPLVYEHPRIFLHQGWNRIRIDVGDMANAIDLHDVRELRFWCEPLDTPIDLYLDDIILADNTTVLFASAENEPGDLYVKSQGRRLVVGSVDRFELVFGRGQIRQWFDLASDPARLQNLAGKGPLGPEPIIVPPEPHAEVRLADMTQWAVLGPLAESYQTLLEATPLYVVVQGEWRFGSPELPPTETSPYHRWIYSVYRDGRMYVECSGTLGSHRLEAVDLGMAFCCDGAFNFSLHLAESNADASQSRAHQPPYLLFSRRGQGLADCLIAPFAPLALQTLENPEDSRLCAFYRVIPSGDRFVFTAMTRFWPPDIDTATEAGPMAADYGNPFPIEVYTGTLVRTDPGDYDNDGFSEARGYYVVQLDGNVARIRIDGRNHLRFSPIFKLVDVADRDLWVYVDGREITDLQRNRDGEVLFAVPGIVSQQTLIEVTSLTRATDSKP